MSAPIGEFTQQVNAGKARSKGVETSAEVDLLPNLVASFAYTYTDTDNLTTRRPLARIPRNSGSAGLTWEPLRGLSVFVQVYAVSRQSFALGRAGYLPRFLGHVHAIALVASAASTPAMTDSGLAVGVP